MVEKLTKIENRIREICEKSGRDPSEVTLLPITKTRTLKEVLALKEFGYTRYGENMVQEAKNKFFGDDVVLDFEPEWVMVGHLQTNKVKTVAKHASEIQSIDSLKVATLLNKELAKLNKRMKALIQVNTSKEKSKYGFTLDDLMASLDALAKLEFLDFEGFMTLAIDSENDEEVRSCFRQLKEAQKLVNNSGVFCSKLNRLSMGMTSDYEIAIEEGSTEIRLGQAIFGPRQTPDSFYWPQ